MKKILGLALLASAATAGAAHAEGSFSGNLALTSDYVFRGVSQTQNAPAVQGGFDYANGMFYVGTWASVIDFGSGSGLSVDAPMELDLYAGFKPVEVILMDSKYDDRRFNVFRPGVRGRTDRYIATFEKPPN